MINVSFDLSNVPCEWLVVRSGNFFTPKSIKNTEGEVNLSVYRDYGVIIKDSREDNHNRVSEDTSNYKLVEPGDFVLNKMKCFQGSLGVSEYRGIVSPSYTVLKPKKPIHNKYFHYLLRSELYRQMYAALSYGVRIGQWELHFHDFKKIPSLYPQIGEQKLISRYLDKKIDQIDKLIEKIQLKIHLLDEKHTSLIKQCVAEDFDSNVGVNYNNSEIRKKKIKYLFKISKGVMPQILNNEIEKDNFPYLSMNVLRGGRPTEFTKIDNCVFVSKGDIGILWDGSNAGEILKMNLDGVLSSTVALLTIKDPNLNQNYAFYVLKSYENLIKFNTNGMGIPHVDGNSLKNIEVYLPSIDIQKKIVNNLERKLSKLIKLRSYHFDKFLLLKEYKESTIFLAVTGKMKIKENIG